MRTKFACIDDFLGEKSARFFSNGYKRTVRTINNVLITALGAEAMCSVSVPGDWSIKGNKRQVAHLSSLDAALMALQLSEAYCVVFYALTAAMRREITIISFSMKAGKTPLEDLENFKSTTTLSSVEGTLYSFTSNIGGMTVDLQLRLPSAHDSIVLPIEGIHHETIDAILGEPSKNFYGIGFADVDHNIKDVTVDLDAASVTASINCNFPSRTSYQGMETILDHCASTIDTMVITSQLAQCYLYLLDGVSRANSSTLWMRAMTFSAVDSAANDTSSSHIDVVRSERVLVEGKPWRCVNIKGYFGGMNIFYALGHALPL